MALVPVVGGVYGSRSIWQTQTSATGFNVTGTSFNQPMISDWVSVGKDYSFLDIGMICNFRIVGAGIYSYAVMYLERQEDGIEEVIGASGAFTHTTGQWRPLLIKQRPGAATNNVNLTVGSRANNNHDEFMDVAAHPFLTMSGPLRVKVSSGTYRVELRASAYNDDTEFWYLRERMLQVVPVVL